MANGLFERIRGRITNSSCEGCGSSKWDVIEGSSEGTPGIVFAPHGDSDAKPRRIQTVLTVCQNCGYVRQFALRKPAAPSEDAA